MIETGLIFMAGFLSAAVLALLILPALSRRANRLARRRLEAQFPMSIDELTAQMDHIRAEGAIAINKAERTLERERDELAKARTQLSQVKVAANQASDQNTTLDEELKVLRGKLETVIEERDTRRIAVASLETRVHNLTAQVRDLEDKLRQEKEHSSGMTTMAAQTAENAQLRRRIAEVAQAIISATNDDKAATPETAAETKQVSAA